MQKTERDHVKMINSPDEWPRWPVLPMKRIGGNFECAIMLAYENCYGREGMVVWETTMFQIPVKEVKNSANDGTHTVIDFDALRKVPYVTYKNANEVVRAGWRVD